MRPRFKRATAIAAMTVIATFTIAGCSSAGGGSSTPTASVKPTGDITLWVGSWWSDQVPKIEDAWNKAHPEIKLTIDPIPITGYLDKFTAAALGGTPPDIIDLDVSWLSSVAGQHLLEPLDDVAKTVDVKDYAPGPWKASQFKGVQYAMPDRSASIAAFYNKTVFDKAGVEYPTSSWTFDDLLKTAQKLTDPATNTYGLGLSADLSDPQNAMDLLATSIWGHGGDFMNKAQTKATLSTKQSIAGLTYWSQLYTKYKVAPPGTPGFATTRDLLPLFEANQIGIFIGGSNNLPTLDALPSVKYGTIVVPSKANISGGYTMGVPVGSKNPDAAKVFIKWFAQPKIMGTLMNRTPARLSALKIAPWNAEEYTVFNEALKDARSLPSVANWSQMQTIIITESQKILVGQETPTQAAKAMDSQINAILAQG